MNEVDLIAGLVKKNPSAINYFVNQYQQFIYVLCLRMLNNKETSEELAQDVLIKCIEKIKLFEARSKLKTWVYKVTHNEVLNYLRKNQLSTLELKEGQIKMTNKGGVLEDMNTLDLKRLIQQYLDQLTVDQKELLTLFYLKELSLKEIGEITGLSMSNVRVKLYRARENFKKLLLKKDITLINELRNE